MYIDALAAAAIADDLRRSIGGARVQAVLPVDRLSLGFELFSGRRNYLTLTADPGRQGLRLSEARVRRGDATATPLALAARSRLVGARLRDIQAPRHERILRFSFEAAEPLTLIAELMGRMSNVILLDSRGTILACARLVTPEMTSVRVVLPGRPYAPPPAPPKEDPGSTGPDDLAEWLDQVDVGSRGQAWRVLVARLLGISPLFACEVVYRVTRDAMTLADAVDPALLFAALEEELARCASDERTPSIASRDDQVIAWAPYALTHLGDDAAKGGRAEVERVDLTVEALERFEAARALEDPYRAARISVSASIDEAGSLLARRRDALQREADAADPETRERLKMWGELLLAWQWQIPAKAKVTELPPEGVDDPPRMSIELDPTKSAVENAQAYFDEYKRTGRANIAVRSRLQRVKAELATLEQWRADLLLAEDRSEIDAVHEALLESGWTGRTGGRNVGQDDGRKKRRRSPRSASPRGPLRLVSDDGLTILVGRNSRQNEVVTFSKAVRSDLWLHVREAPGAHVIIKRAGRDVPEQTIMEAAAIAAWYSRERDRPSVAVAVTEVKHVSRMRGGGPGMVNYRNERTVNVAPRSPESLETETE